MFKTKLFIVSVLAFFLCAPEWSIALDRDDRVTILWPSEEYRTIQSAIDALPDGGALEIAEGEYFIAEPIFVVGKSIVIKGAGSGLKLEKAKDCKEDTKRERDETVRTDKKPCTHLIGPEPRPVLDADRNVILRAEEANGLFNFIGADVVVRNLKISGFDAGIVAKDGDRGNFASVMVTNILITDTGRGILAQSSGDVTVQSSAVFNTLWHGVILSPPEGMFNKAIVKDIFIRDPGGAAIYLNNTFGFVTGADVAGGLDGGIVCFDCDVIIFNSHIHHNNKYGILLVLIRDTAHIAYNLIENTYPDIFTLHFGDGITMALSPVNSQKMVTIWNNDIINSSRAGIANFGGSAALGNNTLQCAGYELEGEPFMGRNFKFRDDFGNVCGCPTAAGVCVAESAGMAPPEPTAPIE